ncbi:glycerophosphodiester phosphodiesterase family protein [Microbispora sp. ATCC PTA-5024]|uniref:glycerophosphodiester phosphodiesterase family protein n=1 Tax=Microbispora sp. ATCC PTA-5024 TaxID=316330 RepID=UPI0003DDAB72|nr:glycerophosphodiester phosphodiesterase family protein [Microbispora sp. ATCC PTA-5024]ETK34692.1 glycerophosphoryl diester phosphodiesterase [Microbispora sp. ATCC PTA-5024]
MQGYVELHGHRGARGLRPENTLPGLAFALELGVDALEFDVAVSADGQLVLTHDLLVSPVTSADTGMAHPGDEMFPYVGRPIISLTLPQLRTLDVGVRLPQRPDDRFAMTQVPLPDTRMPTLGAVLGLIGALGADKVRLNVELKSDPTRPELSADPVRFTELVATELDRHDRLSRAALLSFDWRVLEAARPLVEQRYALVERATMSPAWMNGVRLDEIGGDLAAAADIVGATTLSPDHTLIDEALMESASRRGLPVVAWTVNEPEDASRLADMGVAGIVTDYPDRMRRLWKARGLALPEPVSPLRPVGA